ncbi:MAG: hypothetical protein Ct9H300mP16_03110 [Pseudomonadota bacterium]|nr:MAG: hypothetical protein Ct9H300mP16_03110 [Pseudomonadota bacterium]
MPGVNDLVLAAVAKTLQDYPDLNAGYVDGAMHRYRAITSASPLIPKPAWWCRSSRMQTGLI